MGNIVFETEDTLQQTAEKTVLLFCGTNELKNQMSKLGVSYVKTQRGFNTLYIIRHSSFGRKEIKL